MTHQQKLNKIKWWTTGDEVSLLIGIKSKKNKELLRHWGKLIQHYEYEKGLTFGKESAIRTIKDALNIE